MEEAQEVARAVTEGHNALGKLHEQILSLLATLSTKVLSQSAEIEKLKAELEQLKQVTSLKRKSKHQATLFEIFAPNDGFVYVKRPKVQSKPAEQQDNSEASWKVRQPKEN